jgi:transcription initiation factor TFIIE subunit alpha
MKKSKRFSGASKKKIKKAKVSAKKHKKEKRAEKKAKKKQFSEKLKSMIFCVVREVAGEDTLPVVEMLLKNESVSEYEIADLIRRDINQTRNLLYALHKSNLVYSVRKKDKIKGWYIYYWSFDDNRVCELYEKIQARKIQQTESLIEREDGNCFFACPNKCIRLDFEHAMNFNFKCPECGSLMDREDNTKKVEGLKHELDALNRQCKKLGL